MGSDLINYWDGVGNAVNYITDCVSAGWQWGTDMIVSPQMAVADGDVMTDAGMSGSMNLAAGIVSALKDVLGNQKGQQRNLAIPVYLGNQLLDEVIVTAQQRMGLRSGGGREDGFFSILCFDEGNLPLLDFHEVELEDVEADSDGKMETGTTRRNVVRHGVETGRDICDGDKAKLKRIPVIRGCGR